MAAKGKKEQEKVKEEENDEFNLDKIPNLSKEAKEKLEKIKKEVDRFKKEVIAKFDKYIMGISLLPPQPKQKFPQPALPGMLSGLSPVPMNKAVPVPHQPAAEESEISVMVLVDDSDSKKMSKYELKSKLSQIIEKIAKVLKVKMSDLF